MQINCPACGKTNDTPDDRKTVACARCGCDLTRLFHVFVSAAQHLSEATEYMRHKKFIEAREHAEKSWLLKNSAEAAQIAALASIGSGHHEDVLLWRQRAGKK